MPGFMDALRARRGGGQPTLSIRGVGDEFSADVPDSDPYGAQVVGGNVSRGDFLTSRLDEITRNYRKNDMEGVLRAQEMRDAVSMAAERGKAARYGDPAVRGMREDQEATSLRQLEAKAYPDRVKAEYGLEEARLGADSRTRASVESARLRALAQQLSGLEKLRYSGDVPSKVPGREGSLMSGIFGGRFTDEGPQANPDASALDTRISALRRQLDSAPEDEIGTDDDLSMILEELRRRGITVP